MNSYELFVSRDVVFIEHVLPFMNKVKAKQSQTRKNEFDDLVMGHGVSPYLGLNEIGNPSPMINFIIISYLFNCIFLDLSISTFGFIY